MQMSKQKTQTTASMKGERQEVDYYDRAGVLRYVLTSSPTRDTFYLYAVTGEKMSRLGKGTSPTELEEQYDVANHLKA